MKRVVVLTNSGSGLVSFRGELMQILSQKYEVYAVLPDDDRCQDLEAMECKVVVIPLERRGMNPLTDLRLLIGYVKLIRELKPDCVLTYTIKPNVYGGLAARLFRCPYIANITGLGTAVENPGLMQFLTTNLYKVGLRKASCVMYQNTANEEFFNEKRILKKTTHTYQLNGSGVNLNYYVYRDYPTGDTVNFLFVGRLLKEKGIDLYLEAADAICSNHKNVMFHICGGYDDMKYEALLADEKRKDYVIYHGVQKQMTPFYEMASCIVHPSYYPEGMSNVLQEASATGRPVITTNRSGCREVVEDGKTGYLIPVRDVDALIAALEKFLQLSVQTRAEMGKAARCKMEKEFSRQRVVDIYTREIEELVK